MKEKKQQVEVGWFPVDGRMKLWIILLSSTAFHDLALMFMFALLPLSMDSRHYHYVKLCSLPCIWNCLLASLPAKYSSISLANTPFLPVSLPSQAKPRSVAPDREEHSFSSVSVELCTHNHQSRHLLWGVVDFFCLPRLPDNIPGA